MISNIIHGADVDIVVIAGTGSGKSLCFQAIPLVNHGAIVLAISLTIALMEGQVPRLKFPNSREKGLTADTGKLYARARN